jgi:glycine/D-amino acid oxidase-like deaminating enzyme
LQNADVIVIGAGMVGAAIGCGLAKRGLRVLTLDGGDGDYRAARANFGLVWLQGKGVEMPAYSALTRRSVLAWREFGREIEATSDVDLRLEQNGGLAFCLGEAEFAERANRLQRLHNQTAQDAPDYEMVDRATLARLLPGVELGRDVTGASLGRLDGHVDPLRLLRALHSCLRRRGGEILNGHPVSKIEPSLQGFTLDTPSGRFAAAKIVIAAGVATTSLARQVDLDVPIRPQRGQILVTERFAPILPLPASGIRQTAEGSIMIGATQEEVGYDTDATVASAVKLAALAVRRLPALAGAKLVRQWAGLRVMTPDGFPVYAQSQAFPGAFVAACHSGVTLAALHANEIADAVADGAIPELFSPFHHRRFDVPQAA